MDKQINQKLDLIFDAIKSLESRVTLIETGTTGRAGSGNKASGRTAAKKTSIREFLLEHPPTTDIQRTLAVGHFLETHSGMTSFSMADLKKGYSDAKEPPPSNMSVNITHCIKQGHMMEAPEKKHNKTAWVVTTRGEQFVAGGYKKSSGGK